jgi:predicted membrane protein
MRRLQNPFTVIILLVAAGLIIAGCATIFKGSDQSIKINSTPSQAKVVIKTTGGVLKWEGVTPATTKLSKKDEYVATISLTGYKDKEISISHTGIEGWFWGNLLCGGVIGIVVDLVTGAIHTMGPEDINVTLATAQLENGRIAIYAVFQALDSKGELRSLAVPLEPDSRELAQRK